MEDQRKNELAVVIAATVVFGFMNRILIRIPYMVLRNLVFLFDICCDVVNCCRKGKRILRRKKRSCIYGVSVSAILCFTF